jgi:hypothetical protein
MAEKMVLMLVGNSADMFISLDLRGGGRKKIDVHPVIASAEGSKVSRDVGAIRSLHRKGMRRRDVG